MFVGQSIQSLDDKGRIVLKSKVRSQLTSTTVYLLFDLGHCLSIYSEDEYLIKAKEMSQLDDFNSDERALKRIFFANSFETSIDKQGRIAIPKFLLSKAKIEKDVVVVGAFSHLQVYALETFNNELASYEDDYEALASKVNAAKYAKWLP